MAVKNQFQFCYEKKIAFRDFEKVQTMVSETNWTSILSSLVHIIT